MAVGPRLPSGSTIFVLGSSIAVLSPTGEQTNGVETGPWSIRTVLRARTSFGRVLVVPAMTVSQGPLIRRTGFWFASGDSVYLLDVSTGAVLRSENLRAPIASISVDPSGALVYVGIDELETHPLAKISSVVDELKATTGRVLSHDGFDFTLGPIGVDAVKGGVWVSYRGGMAGSVYLLRARGLVVATGPVAATELKILAGGSPAIGGIWPTSIGSTLWLAGGQGTGCVVPSSGVFLAGTAFPVRDGQIVAWTPFADWNGHVYATEEVPARGATEIVAVTVPRGCR
jgi:hypothetical protein